MLSAALTILLASGPSLTGGECGDSKGPLQVLQEAIAQADAIRRRADAYRSAAGLAVRYAAEDRSFVDLVLRVATGDGNPPPALADAIGRVDQGRLDPGAWIALLQEILKNRDGAQKTLNRIGAECHARKDLPCLRNVYRALAVGGYAMELPLAARNLENHLGAGRPIVFTREEIERDDAVREGLAGFDRIADQKIQRLLRRHPRQPIEFEIRQEEAGVIAGSPDLQFASGLFTIRRIERVKIVPDPGGGSGVRRTEAYHVMREVRYEFQDRYDWNPGGAIGEGWGSANLTFKDDWGQALVDGGLAKEFDMSARWVSRAYRVMEPPTAYVEPDGATLRGPDGTVYRVKDGVRRAIPDAATLAYVGNGPNRFVETVDPEDLAAIAEGKPLPSRFDGSFYRSGSDPAIYVLLKDGRAYTVASKEVLDLLGLVPGDAVPIDASDLKEIPFDGTADVDRFATLKNKIP